MISGRGPSCKQTYPPPPSPNHDFLKMLNFGPVVIEILGLVSNKLGTKHPLRQET